METIEALNVPKVLGVTVTDGKWSIIKEYVPGKTLEQLMDENPDKLDEYMSQMVDLQLLIHSQACPLLNKLKEKTIRSLKSVEQLDEGTRYELLTRLDGMPKHTKLCHGDFNPSNIIVGDDGKLYVIDWVHASQGGARSKQYRVAKQSVMRALTSSYAGRKERKRQFRQLWIARINAAARINGLSYSKFMYGLKLAEVDLNRKVLSDMAINDAEGFAKLAELAKSKLA